MWKSKPDKKVPRLAVGVRGGDQKSGLLSVIFGWSRYHDTMNVVGCADSINICGGKEEGGRGQLNFLIKKKRGGRGVLCCFLAGNEICAG